MVRVRVLLVLWNSVYLACEKCLLLDVCTCTNDKWCQMFLISVQQSSSAALTPCGVFLPERCFRIFHKPTLAKGFVAFMTAPMSRLYTAVFRTPNLAEKNNFNFVLASILSTFFWERDPRFSLRFPASSLPLASSFRFGAVVSFVTVSRAAVAKFGGTLVLLIIFSPTSLQRRQHICTPHGNQHSPSLQIYLRRCTVPPVCHFPTVLVFFLTFSTVHLAP